MSTPNDSNNTSSNNHHPFHQGDSYSSHFSQQPPQDPQGEKATKKKSSFFTLVLGLLATAMVATSFSRNPMQFMQPVIFQLGTYTIRANEFQLLMKKEQILSTLTNRPLKTEKELCSKLIDHLTLDLEAETLGLDLSDNSAKLALQKYPLLQENGQFSQKRLQKLLMHHGLGIQDLIEAQKRMMIRDRLLGALGDYVTLPETLKKLWLMGRFQIREGFYKKLTLPPMVIEPATTEALKQLYETHKKDMTVPSYRCYSFLRISGSSKDQENLFTTIDNALAQGKTLQDIAQEQNLKLQKIKINAKDHQDYKGEENLLPDLLENNPDILDTLDNLTVGSGDLIILSEQEGLYVYLDDITTERALGYEEVLTQQKLQEIYQEQFHKNMIEKEFLKLKTILDNPLASEKEKNSLRKTMEKIVASDIHRKPKDDAGDIAQHLFYAMPQNSLLFWSDKVPYIVSLGHIKTKDIPEKSDQERILLSTFREMLLQCFLTSLGQKFRTSEAWMQLMSTVLKKKNNTPENMA